MNATELKKAIKISLFESCDDGRQIATPYVIGEKGDGKSTIIKEVCAENNAHVIDIRLALEDVPDLKGFPFIDDNGKTSFATPSWIPHGEVLDEILKDHDYVVIFFDEMARAKLDVHQVIFKMVLDYAHQDIVFSEKVRFIAADNPATKDYKGVNKLDSALLDRFMRLDYSGPTIHEWIAYEDGKSNSLMTRFIQTNERLYRSGMASPRTLSHIGRRILNSSARDEPELLYHLVEGKCGPEFAAAFIRYYESSYDSVKASDLFERGDSDFKKLVAKIESWNSEDGKMSDALADTAFDILEYFKEPENIINLSVKRLISVFNAMPDDRVWMIVRTFMDNSASDYPAPYQNITATMSKNDDIRAIIARIDRKLR